MNTSSPARSNGFPVLHSWTREDKLVAAGLFLWMLSWGLAVLSRRLLP